MGVLFFTVSCSFSTDTLIIWKLDWRWAPSEGVCVYFHWSLSTQGHLRGNSPLEISLDYTCSTNMDHKPCEAGLWMQCSTPGSIRTYSSLPLHWRGSFSFLASPRKLLTDSPTCTGHMLSLLPPCSLLQTVNQARSSTWPNSAKCLQQKLALAPTHLPGHLASLCLGSTSISLLTQLSNRLYHTSFSTLVVQLGRSLSIPNPPRSQWHKSFYIYANNLIRCYCVSCLISGPSLCARQKQLLRQYHNILQQMEWWPENLCTRQVTTLLQTSISSCMKSDDREVDLKNKQDSPSSSVRMELTKCYVGDARVRQ